MINHEKLKASFAATKEKYLQKKDHFMMRMEKMLLKGHDDVAGQMRTLFDRLENTMRFLQETLYAKSPAQADSSLVAAKIKEFKKAYKQLNELSKPVIQQWAEAIFIALALALVLRNFIFGLYHVPTGSAEPNILVGDRIWGNKMAYYFGDVKRGELVIFDNPEFNYDRSSTINRLWQKYVGFPIPLLGLGVGPDNVVKRVIAVPGDVVQGRIEDNKTTIYVNGKKIDEQYVNPYPLIRLRKTTGFISFQSFGPLRVPSFLQQQTKSVNYTYVPGIDYDQQPFYRFTQDEIVKRSDTGEMILSEPYSPCYVVDMGGQELVYSVDTFGPMTVPAGKYWTMGDSRKNSRDSRYWGFLDQSLIHGRASFVSYSIDSEEPFWLFEMIKHPISFWTKNLRWNRFFKGLGGFNGKQE
ncbi:MAG: signal peptidase I [Myxococcales bacterium]|nr:signal peptidase I [Myxococcales bacterium]